MTRCSGIHSRPHRLSQADLDFCQRLHGGPRRSLGEVGDCGRVKATPLGNAADRGAKRQFKNVASHFLHQGMCSIGLDIAVVQWPAGIQIAWGIGTFGQERSLSGFTWSGAVTGRQGGGDTVRKLPAQQDRSALLEKARVYSPTWHPVTEPIAEVIRTALVRGVQCHGQCSIVAGIPTYRVLCEVGSLLAQFLPEVLALGVDISEPQE